MEHIIGAGMEVACRAGKLILENGGEIYRVEDTMQYICRSFGMENCESYATPTSIMLSVVDSGGQAHTRMMRIRTRGVNLYKLEEINRFSREIANTPVSIPEAKRRLEEIDAAQTYEWWWIVLISALGTGAFSVVFGGGVGYFFCGGLMGAALRLLIMALNRVRLGAFTANLICGGAAALGGWLFTASGILSQWWIVTLAALTLLVPGLLIVNALRDTVAGDLLSGISRGIEAVSIAAALAFGAAATMMMLTGLAGG